MSSSYDPYDFSTDRHGYSAYQSDYPNASSYDQRSGRGRRFEAQPISSKTYRDPGHSTKSRTEYAVRSRPKSSSISGGDPRQLTIRTKEPPSKTHSPITSTRYPESSSPLRSESQQYLVPSSSRRGPDHRRVYSTDYASDTGHLHPSSAMVSHRMGNGAYPPYARRTPPRYPAAGGFKKGDDIDGYDAYSYTNPREQFEKESIARVGYNKGGHRRERPLSLTGAEEYYPRLAKESRVQGPPPSRRGFDKLDREPRSRRSAHGAKDDDSAEESRYLRRNPAPVSLHQGDDGGYSSYREDYDNSRHRRQRSHRRDDSGNQRTYDDRALRMGHAGDSLVSDSGTGHGNSVNDIDHSPRPDHHRSHDPDRSYSRKGIDARERSDRNHDHRSRRSRRQESDSDASSSGGVHKHKREPSARRRYSGSDASDSSNEEAPQHLIVGRPRRRRHSYSRDRVGDRSPSRVSSHQGSISAQEDPNKWIVPSSPSVKEPEAPPKGILKPPRDKFPEEPNPVREGVAPLKDANKKGIPPGARWTKIDRRIVNPAALEAGNERFEERADCVIVLRVLSKEEIQAYAVKTQEIRGTLLPHSPPLLQNLIGETDARYKEYTQDRRRRREEERRRGRPVESSSDDEDDYEADGDNDDTQFAIEGLAEPDKDSLPQGGHTNSQNQAVQEPARAD